MGKSLYIAEKPSVAQEFARVLGVNGQRHDGYVESSDSVVTWCVGHLVTMSYPDKYDPALAKWSFDTLPFLPKEFRYEVIPGVEKQFSIVKGLLNRDDVDTIYVCTDSGREGEYIYRLVAQEAGVKNKKQLRVWIDSQTEEEIKRGIREAKDLSEYDHLSDAAYLRAKEDYLMGINFSRALSLRYAFHVKDLLKAPKYQAISVGRVMTCVLGMVVRREREIRSFVKTPFYRIISTLSLAGESFTGEWKALEGSRYFASPNLYKDNGFKERMYAEKLIGELSSPFLEAFLAGENPGEGLPEEVKGRLLAAKPGEYLEEEFLPPLQMNALVESIERKKETKKPPLLFNLAELQNVCSKLFKISPDETLKIVQELYEKKLVTYPRTDARVLSSAVAKEIIGNLKGLLGYDICASVAQGAIDLGTYKDIAKTRYTNDKQITDHYAIIPTGQGLGALKGLSQTAQRVYETIVRRFLAIFYPPAVYQKVSLITKMDTERFTSSFKVLLEEGFLAMATNSFAKRDKAVPAEGEDEETMDADANLLDALSKLKKGAILPVPCLSIKEGETSPPKRYNSGSMILAMENAGQLIEDEELRAQIKGSGIGTSATRAEILKKLFNINYLALNQKTQVISPTQLGEIVYDVVFCSIRSLLNPDLTASWEKGLTYVAEGTITSDEYMEKLEKFVAVRTQAVRQGDFRQVLTGLYKQTAPFYEKKETEGNTGKGRGKGSRGKKEG